MRESTSPITTRFKSLIIQTALFSSSMSTRWRRRTRLNSAPTPCTKRSSILTAMPNPRSCSSAGSRPKTTTGNNSVFNHGNDKNLFNVTQPADQRTVLSTVSPTTGQTLLSVFQQELQALSEGSPKGQYTAEQALSIAQILLPDVLTYDYTSAAGYLNGRRLQDDVIDISLNLATNGKVTGDGVGPHTDYLADFPYLGK